MIFRFVIIFLFAQIHGGAMASETATKTAYDFVFKSIEGEHLPLSSFSGKAVLIVNTAFHCGFNR